MVEFNHITRISGERIKSGSKWTLRISAVGNKGEEKHVSLFMETKK